MTITLASWGNLPMSQMNVPAGFVAKKPILYWELPGHESALKSSCYSSSSILGPVVKAATFRITYILLYHESG
jgi:hypothetical protein